MKKTVAQGMSLRLELFVSDLPASIEFYLRVLKFEPGEQHSDGYTPMRNGDVELGLNLRAVLPEDHPLHAVAEAQPGLGIEIVFEVDDVAAMYEHVLSQKWPLSDKLRHQRWGLTDFRVVDPDGYYLRITSRE